MVHLNFNILVLVFNQVYVGSFFLFPWELIDAMLCMLFLFWGVDFILWVKEIKR